VLETPLDYLASAEHEPIMWSAHKRTGKASILARGGWVFE